MLMMKTMMTAEATAAISQQTVTQRIHNYSIASLLPAAVDGRYGEIPIPYIIYCIVVDI